MTNPAMQGGAPDDSYHSLLEVRTQHVTLLQMQQNVKSAAALKKEISAFIRRAQGSGAVLFEGDQRVAAQGLIDYWTTLLYRAGERIAYAPLAAFSKDNAPDVPCPYVGLQAFRQEDRENFFGRTAVVELVLDKLRSRRLVAVLGPSGSGKSSLVMAAIVPKLMEPAPTGEAPWRHVQMVPGSEPLKNLAAALEPAIGTSASELEQKLRKKDNALAKLAGTGAPLLLVIDQCEELFTLCDDEAEQRTFASNLVSLVRADGGHTVIVTMRSDKDYYLARFPDLQELINLGDVRATAPSKAELREAIEEPARRVNLRLERGLSEALAEELVGDLAALPLLQFTMWKLWEEREGNWISMAAYRRLGGGLQALGNTGHQLWKDSSEETRRTMRRVMLRMVRPGVGSKETTSSRVRVAELMQIDVRERVRSVINKLVEARLIRRTGDKDSADEQVEVSHEALIRLWPELDKWVEEKRQDLLELRQLEAIAERWDRNGRDSGFLDQKTLDSAKEWLDGSVVEDVGAKPTLRALVDASEERIANRKKLEERGRLIWRSLVAGVIVALAAAVVFLWFAVKSAREEALAIAALNERTRALAKYATQDPDARVRDLGRIVLELRTENDRLRAQLGQVAAPPPATTTAPQIDPEKEQKEAMKKELREAREWGEKLQQDLDAARVFSDSQTDVLIDLQYEKSRLETEIGVLRDRLDHARTVYPKFPRSTTGREDPSGKLLINQLVFTAHRDAKPASICCFLKDDNEHFLVTKGSAVAGIEGDTVLVRANGTTYRIGVLWKQEGDAAIVRLLDGVATWERFASLRPNDDWDEFDGPTHIVRSGSPVNILGSPVLKGKILDVNDTTLDDDDKTIEIEAESPIAASAMGSPVILNDHGLLGLVTSIDEKRATVTLIKPLLRAAGAKLDD